MNSSDEGEIDFWKQFKQKRENHWNRIFEKYELSEDEDDETTISIKDIANVYGKMSRNRSSVQNNVYEECRRSAIKGEKEVAETSGLPCKSGRPPTKNNTGIKIEDEEVEVSNIDESSNENIKCRRGGRPRKNIKEENTNELNHENVIVRNGIESTYDTIAPKRGRAALNNSLKENPDRTNPRKSTRLSKTNTRINIKNKEVEVGNTHEISNEEQKRKGATPRSSKNRRAKNSLEEIIITEDDEIENTFNVISRKRDKTALKNNLIVNPYNTNTCNPTKYFLRPQIKQNSTKTGIIKKRFDDHGSRKRGRPHLDKIILEEMNATNIKNKSSTKYKSYIVHSSCIKDLQQKYLDGYKIIKEFSKSFTVVSNKKKRSPRSKSYTSYSSKRLKSLQPLFYTTDKNEKQDKTLTKTYDSPPRKTSCRSKNKNYNNTLLKQKQPLYTEDEKKNPDQYANEKSSQTITAASSINEKVLQDVSDSDVLNTKFIIEEKLKSY